MSRALNKNSKNFPLTRFDIDFPNQTYFSFWINKLNGVCYVRENEAITEGKRWWWSFFSPFSLSRPGRFISCPESALSCANEVKEKVARIETWLELKLSHRSNGRKFLSNAICVSNFFLVFAVPPMLSIPNQLEGAYMGQDISLVCNTEAYPTSINYWTTERGEMIFSGKPIGPFLGDFFACLFAKLFGKVDEGCLSAYE